VWAWRPKRASKIAKLYDHLLTLLPFEPPLFEVEGLPSTFVGHAVLEGGANKGNGIAFRELYGIPAKDKIIVLLLGSRIGEIESLCNVFEETINNLKFKFPNLHFVIPTVPTLIEKVTAITREWKHLAIVLEDENKKFDAFAAADLAIAASGTVALELAVARTPAIIVYKANYLTWILTRKLVKVKYANLVNIILNSEEIPELLQKNCRSDILTIKVKELLNNKFLRNKQIQAYEKALKQLKPVDYSTGEKASDTILNLLKNK
jgi:lipid-A-disaccharide synthase